MQEDSQILWYAFLLLVTDQYMRHSLAKSINSTKQKIEKSDAIVYID